MQLLAKTLHGLEGVLAEELRQLGATKIEERKRAVAFEGDLKLMYRANLELRTAIRILMPITCLLYTSPSPRDKRQSRMPSSA